MTAFAYGFRDALEAALIIGFAVAVLVRLERPAGARALWMGAGAGALLGFLDRDRPCGRRRNFRGQWLDDV